jgi:hypothetical protein
MSSTFNRGRSQSNFSKIKINPSTRFSSMKSNVRVHSSNHTKNELFTKRPDDGGKSGRAIMLNTNYYDLTIDFTKSINHYDVDVVYVFERRDGTKAETQARSSAKIYTDFFSNFFSEIKPIDYKGTVNLPREIIEKVFKDFDLGIYVYDGQKNIYTVTKIDLNRMSQDGVSCY